jgi:hypothetical protein
VRRLLIAVLVALALILEACGGAGTRLASSSTAQASKQASSTKALLEQFSPATTRTWWALLDGDVTGSWVVRTIDSGRHWHDVWATPTGAIASSAFLNGESRLDCRLGQTGFRASIPVRAPLPHT